MQGNSSGVGARLKASLILRGKRRGSELRRQISHIESSAYLRGKRRSVAYEPD